jgi:hypothetical protein
MSQQDMDRLREVIASELGLSRDERPAVVQWGGGATSYAIAKIAKERHGRDNVTLLFADTLAEDADLHRFTREVSEYLGIPVTRVCDGRTPEQVDVDSRWLSNAMLAKCSHLLKQVPCRKWLEENASPDALLYVGLDWTELHRVPAVVRQWAPWEVALPLTEITDKSKPDWIAELRAAGIQEPLMYRQGYPHNNCGGGCVRGGQAYWAHTARVRPEVFAAKEAHEKHMQDMLGGGHTILRDRRNGRTVPLPLSVVREAVEAQPTLLDLDDWGGCGCFTADVSGEVDRG